MQHLNEDDWHAALWASLPAPVAILDADGVVIATSPKWQAIVDAGGMGLTCCEPGANYLSACTALAARVARAPEIAAGLAEVLAQQRSEYTLEYSAADASDDRRFAFRAYRLDRPSGGAMVANVDNFRRLTVEHEAQVALAQLEAALESMEDAVLIANADGDAIRVNSAFMSLFRLRGSATRGNTLSQFAKVIEAYLPDGTLVAPDQWPVARALRGEVGQRKEFTLRLQSTGERWITEHNYAPIRDAQGKIVGSVVVGRDVTEQRRVTDALRESERLAAETRALQAVMAASDRLWRIHALRDGLRDVLESTVAQLGAETGHIRLIDPRDHSLHLEVELGIASATRRHPSVVQLADECACAMAVRRRARIALDDSRAEGGAALPCAAGCRASQSTPLFDGEGRVLGVLTTGWSTPRRLSANDERWIEVYCRLAAFFVERWRMENEVREGRERLNALVESAADGIATVDAHGAITSANSAMERLFGYAAHELLGRKLDALLAVPIGRRGERGFAPTIAVSLRRTLGRPRELRARRRDGSSFPVVLSMSEIDHLGLFMAIFHDLSERDEMHARLLESVAEEQRRIGTELHDGVQQELTGMALISASARELLQRARSHANVPWEQLQTMLDRLQAGLRDAHHHVQTLARGILPAEIESKGLEAALRELVEQITTASRVDCRLTCRATDDLSSTRANHIYRIVQEAISNALKHAQASVISISLDEQDERWLLEIVDDGRGIGPGLNAAPPGGVGLRTMEYRASLMGGALSVESRASGGTRVRCEIPRVRP